MSAAPLPKADHDPAPEPSAADAEGWALLEALRRRLDDQGSLGRKTATQVSQLAESIGALVSEQRQRAKWANLNSFVAYVIFTVVVGAGFYMLYRSRAHELVEARDAAQRERDQAVQHTNELTAKATARDQADNRAWEVYQLLEAGKRSEAAGKLGALAELPLSRTERAVLAARAHETQVMEVDSALKTAAASFKAGRYAEMIPALEAALVSEPAGARASTMRYFLGVAYAKANELDKAIAALTAAVAAEVDQEDARFQLASALDRAGQYARARTEYDRFATAHPQSGLAVFAMRRSATLARMPATAPVPPTKAVTTPAPTDVKAATPTPTAPTTQPTATPAQTPPTKAPTAPAKTAPTAVKAVSPAPAKAAAPVLPAPTKSAPPTVEAGSGVAPMSIGSDEVKLDPAPRAEPAPSQLPSFDLDRTPAPNPSGPPIEREPAPSQPSPPRGEVPPPPLRFTTSGDPSADDGQTNHAPSADDGHARLEPTPRAEPAPSQLPSTDADRTPPPWPIASPIDREPAPAPPSVPRGEPQPPPTRF
ncbi:MAG: tetratricopeptide repeat protein [Myxococcales bacterium]|nr:tetratricopeptide repeat protein [Myxococcales bacterium]